MKKITLLFMLLVLLFSCNNNKIVIEKFQNESAQFDITYPKKIKSDSINYFEISNYKSLYDDIKTDDRHKLVYIFIEDTIIDKGNILDLIDNDNINYKQYSLDDYKFKIPDKLLNNKKGYYKMTIAVQDIIIGDVVKISNNNQEEDGLEINLIDSRSYHEIYIE